jgi:uncharacterized protein (DUF169 family)
MSNLDTTSETLARLLGTKVPPIAIAFTDTPPDGVAHVAEAAPAGCSYWKMAADGAVFWTSPSDHFGCPVGAHTHAVALPAEVQERLQGLVGTMVQLQYIRREDVAQIPTRRSPLRHAVYAPLDKAPVPPDVVLVKGSARHMMLLAEAAERAGVAGAAPAQGRPTCGVLPQATNSGRTAISFGCVGNRVYTGAGDDEAWFAIPGPALEAVVRGLQVVAEANAQLEVFHRARRDGAA